MRNRVITVPLGYAAFVLYYRRRAERTGVAGSVWPYVWAGVGLFALMCFVPPGIITGIPPFMVGFTALPLVALAGGFLILARLERNWYLAAFSIVLLAIPGISEHIFTQNLQWEWIGATGFSMMVAGALLLGAAVIAWNGTRRAA